MLSRIGKRLRSGAAELQLCRHRVAGASFPQKRSPARGRCMRYMRQGIKAIPADPPGEPRLATHALRGYGPNAAFYSPRADCVACLPVTAFPCRQLSTDEATVSNSAAATDQPTKSLFVVNVEGRRHNGPLLLGLMEYFERHLSRVVRLRRFLRLDCVQLVGSRAGSKAAVGLVPMPSLLQSCGHAGTREQPVAACLAHNT